MKDYFKKDSETTISKLEIQFDLLVFRINFAALFPGFVIFEDKTGSG